MLDAAQETSSPKKSTATGSEMTSLSHGEASATAVVMLHEHQKPEFDSISALRDFPGSEASSEDLLDLEWQDLCAYMPPWHDHEEENFKWDSLPEAGVRTFSPIQEMMSSSVISETTSTSSREEKDARRALEGLQESESGVHACHECQASFQRVFELEEHGRSKGHKPFVCDDCGKRFTRRDARSRHAIVHSSRGSHPCPRCEKYQGRQAFKRRDLLKKHMRVVHRESSLPRSRLQTACTASLEHQVRKQSDWRRHSTHNIRDKTGSEDRCHEIQHTPGYRVDHDSFGEYEVIPPYFEAGTEQWLCS